MHIRLSGRGHHLLCALLNGLFEGRCVEALTISTSSTLIHKSLHTHSFTHVFTLLSDMHAHTLTCNTLSSVHPQTASSLGTHNTHTHHACAHGLAHVHFLVAHLFDVLTSTLTLFLVQRPSTGTPICPTKHAGHNGGVGAHAQVPPAGSQRRHRAPGVPPADRYLPAHQRADLRW